MSRMAGFYIAKVVERTAAARNAPTRAGGHAAPDAIRAPGRGRSASHRVAAVVHRFIGALARAGDHVWRLGCWAFSSLRWERERERA